MGDELWFYYTGRNGLHSTRWIREDNPKLLAGRLGLSSKTVQNHLVMLKDKLGLHEPAELVHYAIKHGHIEAP